MISVSNSSAALRISGCRMQLLLPLPAVDRRLGSRSSSASRGWRLVRQRCEVDPNVPAGNSGEAFAPASAAVRAARNTAVLEYRLFGTRRPVDLARKLLRAPPARRNPPSYLQSQQGFASRRRRPRRRRSRLQLRRSAATVGRGFSVLRAFFFERRGSALGSGWSARRSDWSWLRPGPLAALRARCLTRWRLALTPASQFGHQRRQRVEVFELAEADQGHFDERADVRALPQAASASDRESGPSPAAFPGRAACPALRPAACSPAAVCSSRSGGQPTSAARQSRK